MPGKSHGPRSLVGYNPWGRKESDMTERLVYVCVCVCVCVCVSWIWRRAKERYSSFKWDILVPSCHRPPWPPTLAPEACSGTFPQPSSRRISYFSPNPQLKKSHYSPSVHLQRLESIKKKKKSLWHKQFKAQSSNLELVYLSWSLIINVALLIPYLKHKQQKLFKLITWAFTFWGFFTSPQI